MFAARGAKDVPTDKIRSYLSYLTHGHIYSYEGEKTNEGTKTRLLQVINRGSHKPHTRTHIQLEIHIVFSEVLASEKFPRILGEERGGFNRGSHKLITNHTHGLIFNYLLTPRPWPCLTVVCCVSPPGVTLAVFVLQYLSSYLLSYLSG